MKKSILSILIGLQLSACAPQGVYYDQQTTSTQSVKAWSLSDFPLTVYVPTEMNAYRVAIENSAQTWEAAFGRKVFNFIFDNPAYPNTQWTGTCQSMGDNYFGLFKLNNWNIANDCNSNSVGFVSNDVLAFTGTKSQGKIIHADILFNFKYFSFGDVEQNPTDTQLVDLQSVLTHELGHFLGLGHIETSVDPISIMNPSIRKTQSKRYLSNSDIVRVRQLYNFN